MPTGYTSKICEEDSEVKFEDFIMDCARAFGACISLRDSGGDIPKEFEPSYYHRDAIITAKKKLENYIKDAPSQAKQEQLAKKEIQKSIEYWQDVEIKRRKLKIKLDAMLDKVKTWSPPSPDHTGLKDFMIEQLETTILHDADSCSIQIEREKERLKTIEIEANEELIRLANNVAYHQKEWEAEKKRVSGRNKWVRQLRESLK